MEMQALGVVTEQASGETELREVLSAVDEIASYAALLGGVSSFQELDAVLPELLASLGRHAHADRTYLFGLVPENEHALQMTHEWCAPGVSSFKDLMQRLDFRDLPNWLSRLSRGEAVVFTDWEQERLLSPQEYELLKGQDIKSLMLIPLIFGGELKGFAGFDNPEERKRAVSLQVLKAVGAHVMSLRENLRMRERLEAKRRSLEASLAEVDQEKRIMDALSTDYFAVSLCDFEADTMIPLKRQPNSNLDAVDRALGADSGRLSSRLRYYYNTFVIPESAPDFLEKINLEYLSNHLADHDRLSFPFRTRPNPAGREHFEVHLVRLPGTHRFIMGYRYMDDLVAQREQQKKQLETALSEAHLKSEIIESLGKLYWLIYRVDLTKNYFEEIVAEQEVYRLTGKQGRADKVFFEAVDALVSPEYQDAMHAFNDLGTLPERLSQEDSVVQEYLAENGSWHLARFIVKKRDENGRVTHVLYVVRCIDQEKSQELALRQELLDSAEEAKRANLAKTDFLRRMSHDIRTPINGIRGMLSIANRFPDDRERQQECRDKMMQASGFLLSLVNDVLDMNRLESGVVELANEPFDLVDLLDESVHVIETQAQERAIALKRVPKKIRHANLVGSPLHLRQVLQNLASNAVKYNHQGGYIGLSCEELESDHEWATFRFVCHDAGIGMTPEFLERAFEPFSQEDQGARTTYEGTGLGLAITRQLVELMGGTIQIQSQLGVGTKVTVEIPFAIDQEYEKAAQAEGHEVAHSLEGVRVLLVEDNELNMEIAQFVLEQAGMEVTSVWNGKEAVEYFAHSKEGSFDAVLMDVMMPVMNGLEAARAIRALDRSDAASVPILAMTANAFPEDVEASRAAGMNAHLSKPLQEQELLSTIAKLV
ncbi:MAG: ATP-binding protein [Coriobacteriia bacterium]|nr:ATP-binding protein [Coriobacteriia bacterium]